MAFVGRDAVVTNVVASSEETRMPRASRKDLSQVNIGLSDEVTALRASANIEEVRAVALVAPRENQTLAETHVALLPRA